MTSPPPQDHIRLSEIIASLCALDHKEGENATWTIGHMLEILGERAFGAGIVLFAFPNMIPMPPGTSAILGLPLLFITWQVLSGRRVMWLPRRISEKTISIERFKPALEALHRMLIFLETFLKPRLGFLNTWYAERLTGLACFFLTLILLLPLPLMNMVPAAGLILFALGVIEQDGVAILLGWGSVVITALIPIFFFHVIKIFILKNIDFFLSFLPGF